MVVYLEYAFAENFMLDLLLCYLALLCARTERRPLRLTVAAAVGGVEAIVFPLISLPVWAAYLTKIAGGALLPILSVRKGSGKTYFIAVASFFGLTFALGGALTAAYSFFGVEYAEGNGYLVERAPVGLVLAFSGFFALAVSKGIGRFFAFRTAERFLLPCELKGEREVHWKGLADSGNGLTFRGRPVCVLSAAAAYAVLGREAREIGRMEIGTVNGKRASPVYLLPSMKVGETTFEDVPLTVGEVPKGSYQIILHTAYTEVSRGSHEHLEVPSAEDKGRGKCRSLSLRKRGVAPSALGRGGGGSALQIGGGRGDGAGEGTTHRA